MGGPGEGIPGAPTPESGMQGYFECRAVVVQAAEWVQSFYEYMQSIDATCSSILVAVQRIHWDWAGGILNAFLNLFC